MERRPPESRPSRGRRADRGALATAHPTFEFHVSRAARERFGIDDALFGVEGHLLLGDFAASRRLAQALNALRETGGEQGEAIHAGELNALGLLEEVFHHVVALYREQRAPGVMEEALRHLQGRIGSESLDRTLRRFIEQFPPSELYRGEQATDEYLEGSTRGVPNREVVLEELLMVWLANANPAAERLRVLFDDDGFARTGGYRDTVDGLREFFGAQPAFGPRDEDLVSMLRSPALAVPDSVPGQLRYVREHWGFALERFEDRMLISLDVLAEEERATWMRFHATEGGPGAGEVDTAALHGFADMAADEGGEPEPERFSVDLDWMPRLVLLAKSTYVWLDQLARAFGRPIWRLDQIPDEELDRLAGAGFTGLWLIGLWERSHASQRIKQLRGNADAVASAYSLMDYRISEDLGGEEAYSDLRDRAWARGIRLASDMVPNHMGIDSRWVIEHPDWFISRTDVPYPAYTFTGPNLSADPRVGIYLEDHYYDNTDAAVVFKRIDPWSGAERYVYHGNDGTSMPWNDTAQLDFLDPDVREAVIRTILAVARRFPVIRFDAAMVLAKRHIQRLWYPEPGSGGAIPSRAEFAMSKAEFERRMPLEFWREVVDRVAAEAPDTLLLAEAFWLMEGYFVRTLGMHRVYNSAFMNMLRDERNAEYRTVIRNTIEFDPEILKRYVNFMNNPDERTAVDQFGKGDKYFGVCTLMATMPGLPMFGHGQIEGYTEKYGMEFRRAKWEEQPDAELVARHQREIYPLLHRRELFAEVSDFRLYDFQRIDGSVDEDVFAYSNSRGDERSLIVYHNRYAETAGWIRESSAYAVKGTEGERELVRTALADSLAIPNDDSAYVILRDGSSGLEYLRSARELHEKGLYLQLEGYRCHVFLEMAAVADDPSGRWRTLAGWLAGRGVASLEAELHEMRLEPLRARFARMVNAATARELRTVARGPAPDTADAEAHLMERLASDAAELGRSVHHLLGPDEQPTPPEDFTADVRSGLATALRLARAPASRSLPAADTATWLAVLAWLAVRGLGGPPDVSDRSARCRRRMREWRLDPVVALAFGELGRDDGRAWRASEAVAAIVALPMWQPGGVDTADAVLASWLADDGARRALRVHVDRDVEWLDGDAYAELLSWATWVAALRLAAEPPAAHLRADEPMISWLTALARDLAVAIEAAGYRVDRLLQESGAAAEAVRAATQPIAGVAAKPASPAAARSNSEEP